MGSIEKLIRKVRINNLLVLMFFAITTGTIYLSIYINQSLEKSFNEIKKNQDVFMTQKDCVLAKNDSLIKLSNENSRQLFIIKQEIGQEKFEQILNKQKKQ